MKVRALLASGLLLAAASTIAVADEMDVSIACDDDTGTNLQTALSDFYESGKAVLVVTLGAGGLCKILNLSYPITGAVSVFIHGAGTGGSVVYMPGATGAVFQVESGAQFSVDNMTLESASHGAISVADSMLLVDQMIFSGNQVNGGAIVASNGVVTVKRSTFEGNGSSLDGGAIALTGGGSLGVSDSTFHADQTLSSGIGDGGAISATGVPVTIDRVLFNANNPGTIVAARLCRECQPDRAQFHVYGQPGGIRRRNSDSNAGLESNPAQQPYVTWRFGQRQWQRTVCERDDHAVGLYDHEFAGRRQLQRIYDGSDSPRLLRKSWQHMSVQSCNEPCVCRRREPVLECTG